MSVTHVYSSHPDMGGRYYHRGLRHFQVLVSDVRECLNSGGVAHIILEPGDMTRYELVITRLDIGPYTPYLLACLKPSRTFAYRLDPAYLDLFDWDASLNPCTVAVISDLWNHLFAPDTPSVYDWDNARPR